MRGAYGKPNGLCARVKVGQILMSVRIREDKIPQANEALRRAKFKIAGRQTVVVSKNWGFTKLTREEYIKLQEEGKIISDGSDCKVINEKGLLSKRFPIAKDILIPLTTN